ncbi:plastocyanin/azurin family copper-binding protein [Haloarcula laminariae]|uniref:plastocyanin/azurin family copper-binding protein n=1 Tax=Haloarcula laminariae TaxID=2961577 RepID=UPI0021C9E816|nr:plastocyanin/azurin family copper-binding protein [Halomicroarcula laminariae]
MKRRDILKTAGVLSTGGAVGLAGCSSSGDGEGSTDSPPPNTVLMITEGGDYYFDPIGQFVETGETITFEIQSGRHSATAYHEEITSASVTRIPEGASTFNSGTMSNAGATYKHTFDTAGTYDYFCIPHKSVGMVGRIVVGEPGGPAEGSMPPDGSVPEGQSIVDQGSISYNQFTE